MKNTGLLKKSAHLRKQNLLKKLLALENKI